MKKLLNILITLCLIASVVGCWMIAGDSFRKVLDGAEVLAEGESFAQAEGKYISYEAAYPVGSYIEEYYSGDPDRVRTIGYAVYDEDRQAFLYIVVSDRECGAERPYVESASGSGTESGKGYGSFYCAGYCGTYGGGNAGTCFFCIGGK